MMLPGNLANRAASAAFGQGFEDIKLGWGQLMCREVGCEALLPIQYDCEEQRPQLAGINFKLRIQSYIDTYSVVEMHSKEFIAFCSAVTITYSAKPDSLFDIGFCLRLSR